MTTLRDILRDLQVKTINTAKLKEDSELSLIAIQEAFEQDLDEAVETIKERIVG